MISSERNTPFLSILHGLVAFGDAYNGLVTFGHGFIFWKVTDSCRMPGTSILHGLVTFGDAYNGLVTFGHGFEK